jgi:hypothetical protein
LSELAELFVLFLVLYLFECLAWVPRRTVGFFAFAGRWRARLAFRPNASWSVSVVLGKPWPPLSPPWLAEPLPFAVDPRGITHTESDHQPLTWEELAPIAARGNRLESGDLVLATLASRQGAADLAEALEKTRVASAKKREALLRRLLDARFTPDAPEARRRQYAKSVRGLRIVSNGLWLGLFGGLGAAVLTHNMLILLLAAAVTLLLWPVNSILFLLTLRRVSWLPRTCWPERSKRLVTTLSPLSAVRAADILAREIWANLDPLTVAAALLSERDLAGFARPRLIAMQPRNDDDLAWWRTESRKRMEQVLSRRGIDIATLLAPPVREGEHVTTYCPACLSQYEPGRAAGQPCPNEGCPQIPLRAFDDGGHHTPDSPAGAPS